MSRHTWLVPPSAVLNVCPRDVRDTHAARQISHSNPLQVLPLELLSHKDTAVSVRTTRWILVRIIAFVSHMPERINLSKPFTFSLEKNHTKAAYVWSCQYKGWKYVSVRQSTYRTDKTKVVRRVLKPGGQIECKTLNDISFAFAES